MNLTRAIVAELIDLPVWPLALAGFIVGSIPFGVLVARFFYKTDIRATGSGNIGAANALRTLGTKAGVAVLLLDAFKGVAATALPAWLARLLLSEGSAVHPVFVTYVFDGRDVGVGPVMAASGLAAMLGHCYSPWLRLRGGKGVATFLGVLVVAAWPSALAFAVVWAAIVLPTGFSSLGSMLGALTGVTIVALLVGTWTLWFSIPALALVVWQHRENIARLRAGTESRLTLLRRPRTPFGVPERTPPR